MACEELSQLAENYTGVFIFLHGKTRDGPWQKQFFVDLLGDKAHFKHIKVIFPSSPEQYCEYSERVIKAWCSLNKRGEINKQHVDEGVDSLVAIIKKEKENGIPLNRIIIGGISQGGMLAMEAVYNLFSEVAGCIAVSCLILSDNTYEAVQTRTKNPPLFMYHGTEDTEIPVEKARECYQRIMKAGVTGEWREFVGAPHELTLEELELIYDRVNQLIPQQAS